jgi:hypothetical protein
VAVSYDTPRPPVVVNTNFSYRGSPGHILPVIEDLIRLTHEMEPPA